MGILGDIVGLFAGNQQKRTAEKMMGAEQDFYREMYGNALRANRPNQYTPFGSSEWVQDDKGNWVQNMKFSPELQGRLEDFNSIAAQRMGAAKGIDLSRYGKGIDYGSIGLGNLSKAAGNPSMGGNALGNLAAYANPYLMGTNPYLKGPDPSYYEQLMQSMFGGSAPQSPSFAGTPTRGSAGGDFFSNLRSGSPTTPEELRRFIQPAGGNNG